MREKGLIFRRARRKGNTGDCVAYTAGAVYRIVAEEEDTTVSAPGIGFRVRKKYRL
jgi:hypothetical protein